MKKILVIVGPTASGKSDLAVSLAKRLNGEVVSADSRQVYRGLDKGTGKITKREMRGVRHHLLDVADPRRRFTVDAYRRLARVAITDILSRGKLPIVCGGTGLYVDSIFRDADFPDAPPNAELRKKLDGKTAPELLRILKKIDPARARILAQSDSEKNNARRIVRAIEIASADRARGMQKIPLYKWKVRFQNRKRTDPISHEPWKPVFIGIKVAPDLLKRRIRTRLERRLRAGMIAEARRLHAAPPRGRGLSWRRMDDLGLEYRYLANYLRSGLSKSEITERLNAEIWQYAKRQMTWFKRNRNVRWLKIADKNGTGRAIDSLFVDFAGR